MRSFAARWRKRVSGAGRSGAACCTSFRQEFNTASGKLRVSSQCATRGCSDGRELAVTSFTTARPLQTDSLQTLYRTSTYLRQILYSSLL